MIGRTIYNYRIEELIGEGGMGTVYRAVDTVLGREVALKMLHSNLISQSTFFERFKNEAQVLARLNHPNIATLHNFIEDDGDYFMVMEFIEGADLERVLKTSGKLPVETVLQIAEQTLEGLTHAHARGVFHRDLKPANLIVTPEKQLKIMDFGIAKAVDSQKLTQVNKLIGTLEYIAPEILKGEEPSAQSDLYAIGVVVYELLTGRMPFVGDTDYDLMQQIIHKKPLRINAEEARIPKELEGIVNKLLNKNPGKRYANADELKVAIANVINDVPKAATNPLAKLSLPAMKMPKVSVPKFTIAEFSLEKINRTWLILAASLIIAIGILTIYKPTPQMEVDPPEAFESSEKEFLEGNQPEDNGAALAPNNLLANVPKDQEELTDPNRTREVERTRKEAGNKDRNKDSGSREKKNSATERERKQERTAETNQLEEPQKKQTDSPKIIQEVVEDKPKIKEDRSPGSVAITLSGQRVVVALRETVNSENVSEQQRLSFKVSKPLILQGKTVFAVGANARGYVSDIRKRSALRKETLEIRITEIQATNGEWVAVKAAVFRQVAESSRSRVIFNSGQQFIAETTYATVQIN